MLSLLQLSGASHLLIECVDGMLYHRNVNDQQAEIICIALRILVDLGYVDERGMPRSSEKLTSALPLAINTHATCTRRLHTGPLNRGDGSSSGQQRSGRRCLNLLCLLIMPGPRESPNFADTIYRCDAICPLTSRMIRTN